MEDLGAWVLGGCRSEEYKILHEVSREFRGVSFCDSLLGASILHFWD